VNALPMPWEYALWFSLALFVLFWIVETTVVHVQDIIFFPIIIIINHHHQSSIIIEISVNQKF
jgi:hypothetical protein